MLSFVQHANLIHFVFSQSDHRVANQRLCQVLDTAIACVSEGNPTAEPTGKCKIFKINFFDSNF